MAADLELRCGTPLGAAGEPGSVCRHFAGLGTRPTHRERETQSECVRGDASAL